jgi:hypothetical protein
MTSLLSQPPTIAASNPAAIEFARQIYTHLFESISLKSMRLLIRHAIYLTQEKRSDQLPLDQEQAVWDAYNITFDHLVAAGEYNSIRVIYSPFMSLFSAIIADLIWLFIR